MTRDKGSTITPDGVRAAAARLNGIVVKTPLLENKTLNERTGGRILLKAETLQHYGSFKLRGAYNRLSQLTAEEKKRGVVAWSSGNHAQGVAYAAKLLGVQATIIMPADAPRIKADNVRALGARIIPYDRYTEDREAIGQALAAKQGLALAPSYDHPAIIQGQGTVGLETAEQAAALGVDLDAMVICCGGGGLAAGCATILKEISPQTELWIAEPEGYDETWASIRDGERAFADVSHRTICDAIATPTPGELTLPILEKTISGGLTVSEREVADAMAFAFSNLKIVLEPGGAAALAGVLFGQLDLNGKTAAVTLSGGNVDFDNFISITK